MRTHSPAFSPGPYHSFLCTYQITICTRHVTDTPRECTCGTCLGANTTHKLLGTEWWRQEARLTGRQFVNWVNCQGVQEQPGVTRSTLRKSENQGTNEEKENHEKEETPVIVTASMKGPSSPFTKPRCRLWSMGLEKMPSASTLRRRVDSYQESYGRKEVWKWSPKG